MDIDGGTRDQPHSHFAREIVSRTGFDGLYSSSVNAAVGRPQAEGARIRMGCLWGLGGSTGRLRRCKMGGCGCNVVWRGGCVLVTGLEALRCD